MADSTDTVFDREIRPFLFPPAAQESDSPELVLLVGQPGAGRSRALGCLLEEMESTPVVLRGADLEPFAESNPVEDVRKWIAAALAAARTQRLSVVLEDSFRSARDLSNLVDAFSADGYRMRIEAMAVSRAESLLAMTAQQMRRPIAGGARAGDARRIVDEETAELEKMIRTAPAATTVVVIGRDGTRHRTQPGDEAVRAWERARRAAFPSRAAAEWISELRRLTSLATSHTGRAGESVLETLAELHRSALQDVLPGIALPTGSSARQQVEARLRRELATLEASISAAIGRGTVRPVEASRTPTASNSQPTGPG